MRPAGGGAPASPAGDGAPRGARPRVSRPLRTLLAVQAAHAPGVREDIALRERVARVDQHLRDAGDPGAARIAGTIAGRSPTRVSSTIRPSKVEPIGDAWVIESPALHQPTGVEDGEPRREAGAGGRAVEPARRDDDRVPGHLADALPGLRDLDDAHAGDRRSSPDGRTRAVRAPRRESPPRRARGRAPPRERARSRVRSRLRSRTTCLRTPRRRRSCRGLRRRAPRRAPRRSTARS